MLKTKFLAPIVAIAVSFAILITASFNATAGETGTRYFIKPVMKDRILLVEPNLLSFVRAEQAAPQASDWLMEALPEIQENYIVNATQLVRVERNNGKAVPNLFVYVQPADTAEASVGEVAISGL